MIKWSLINGHWPQNLGSGSNRGDTGFKYGWVLAVSNSGGVV
jgi:hypothetical protein